MDIPTRTMLVLVILTLVCGCVSSPVKESAGPAMAKDSGSTGGDQSLAQTEIPPAVDPAVSDSKVSGDSENSVPPTTGSAGPTPTSKPKSPESATIAKTTEPVSESPVSTLADPRYVVEDKAGHGEGAVPVVIAAPAQIPETVDSQGSDKPAAAGEPSQAPPGRKAGLTSAAPLSVDGVIESGEEMPPHTADAKPESEAQRVTFAEAGDVTRAAEVPAAGPDQELAMLTREESRPEENLTPADATNGLSLNLAALPVTFGAGWTLDRRPNPVSQKTECVLASAPARISDGYDNTGVQLLLTSNVFYVSTQSNIDLSYPDSGVGVDATLLIPFDGLAKETAAVVKDDVGGLYQRMLAGRELRVRLGFWPTWPVTETQQASFELDGIPDAMRALRACERM